MKQTINGTEFEIKPFANLTDADLTDADLYGANLTHANLTHASLTHANLTDADLYGANLTHANLAGANLTGADLYGANLAGANLTGANLTGANLTGANLDFIKGDVFLILLHAQAEVLGLRQALIEGRVNGQIYKGDCACLVGTLANVRGCSYQALTGIIPDGDRPAERWFLAIKPGDTPASSPIVSITVGWLDEWLLAHGITPAAMAANG